MQEDSLCKRHIYRDINKNVCAWNNLPDLVLTEMRMRSVPSNNIINHKAPNKIFQVCNTCQQQAHIPTCAPKSVYSFPVGHSLVSAVSIGSVLKHIFKRNCLEF